MTRDEIVELRKFGLESDDIPTLQFKKLRGTIMDRINKWRNGPEKINDSLNFANLAASIAYDQGWRPPALTSPSSALAPASDPGKEKMVAQAIAHSQHQDVAWDEWDDTAKEEFELRARAAIAALPAARSAGRMLAMTHEPRVTADAAGLRLARIDSRENLILCETIMFVGGWITSLTPRTALSPLPDLTRLQTRRR